MHFWDLCVDLNEKVHFVSLIMILWCCCFSCSVSGSVSEVIFVPAVGHTRSGYLGLDYTIAFLKLHFF